MGPQPKVLEVGLQQQFWRMETHLARGQGPGPIEPITCSFVVHELRTLLAFPNDEGKSENEYFMTHENHMQSVSQCL